MESMTSAAGQQANNIEAASRVLLVDDQLIIAEGLRRMLAGESDVEFRYCPDPQDAVAVAQQFKPTVILQDLVMPGMNGIMVLKQFRSHPATRDIPVIMLSTNEDPTIKSDAFAEGATDYLVKFPDKIEVLARIRAHSRSFLAQQQRDAAYRQLRDMKIELERKNAELEVLSCRDGLTGVLNRRGFEDYFSKEWMRAIRDKAEMGMLLIDIDHFKDYNDNYGHQGGDQCLRSVATALSAALKRPSDVIGRYGGEEFVVILPDTGVDGARIIAEGLVRTVAALNLPHAYSSASHCVTVSIGLAVVRPTLSDKPEWLVRAADEALYRAKAAGRNCFRCAGSST